MTNTEWLSPAPYGTVRIGNPPDLGQYTPVNGDFSNTELYGLLYNWWVAFDNRNPCPCGFRPPTQLDFQILVNEVGSNSGHLKDTTYWNLPNTGANNSTGFSALPSGYRLQWNLDLSTGCYTSTFIGGTSTVFDMWSSTEGNDNRNGLRLGMNHNSTGIFIGEQRKIGGRAIRCIEE